MNDAPTRQLGVAMIVRNDAKAVRQSLAAFAPIADRIFVFDCSDDESTQAAAPDVDAVWMRGDWNDSYAETRNACWDAIDSDWILWVDAGETMSVQDAELLREFVAHQAERNTGYMLVVTQPTCEPEARDEQIGQVRLVPNRPEIRFRHRVRESLVESLRENGMRLEGMPSRIIGGELAKDQREVVARRELRLADLEIAASGPTPRMLNCIASAHQELGDYEQAATGFAKAIDTAEAGSSEMLEAYYGVLSSLDNLPGAGDRQMHLCLQALDVFPLDSQLLCAMGGYLQHVNRIDLAARSYETAFRFGQVSPDVAHLADVNEISGVCYALSLQLLGQEESALQVFREAAERHPDSQTLKRQLLGAYIRRSMRDEALAMADQLAEAEDRELLGSAIRGACLASEENWLPANAYLKTAFQGGCRDEVCLRWYVVALIKQGDHGGAREVLSVWRSLDPSNPELAQFEEFAAADSEQPASTE